MDLFKYISDAHSTISKYSLILDSEHKVEDLIYVRTEAFKIQAFGRLIKRSGKKSSDEGQMIRTLGDNLKASAKFIEDSIGELLHHYEMSEHLKNMNRLEEAKLRFTIVKSDFEQHQDWILKSLDILKNLDVHALYLKGLVKELKKLEEKCENINPKLLEDGTHELRRTLRWAIMYIIYPTGLFHYKEKSPKTNEYTKLKSVKGAAPLTISFKDVNFLSQAVHRLGEAKDEGLTENYSKTLSEINSSKPHIVDLTKEILNVLKKDKVFSKLRSDIKEQI